MSSAKDTLRSRGMHSPNPATAADVEAQRDWPSHRSTHSHTHIQVPSPAESPSQRQIASPNASPGGAGNVSSSHYSRWARRPSLGSLPPGVLQRRPSGSSASPLSLPTLHMREWRLWMLIAGFFFAMSCALMFMLVTHIDVVRTGGPGSEAGPSMPTAFKLVRQTDTAVALEIGGTPAVDGTHAAAPTSADSDAELQRTKEELQGVQSQLQRAQEESDKAARTAEEKAAELEARLTALAAALASKPADAAPSSSPPATLRHALNIHMLSRLFDKLVLGWPVTIGVLGGSISQRPNFFLDQDDSKHYVDLFVSWLNEEYPVLANSTERELVGIPLEDTRMEHVLENRAVGGTSSSTASFCWTELFPLSGSRATPLPDLMLIDYSVNDAFQLGGTVMYEDGLPLSSLDNMDRLTRDLLQRSESLRLARREEAVTQLQSATTAAAQQQWNHSMELRHSLPGTAVFFVYFAAHRSPEEFKSLQDGHDLIARRYAVPSISEGDWLQSPLRRDPLLHCRTEAQGECDAVNFYYKGGEEKNYDGVHADIHGHRTMFRLLQARLKGMYDNYIASARSSVEDTRLSPSLVSYAPNLDPANAASLRSLRQGGAEQLARAEAEQRERHQDLFKVTSQKEQDEFAIKLARGPTPAQKARAALRTNLLQEAAMIAGGGGGEAAAGAAAAVIPVQLHESQLRYIAPPAIRWAPPLPIGPAHHMFNTLASAFSCRMMYVPYVPETIFNWGTPEANEFLQVIDNQHWELRGTPNHQMKFGMAPVTSYIEGLEAEWAAQRDAVAKSIAPAPLTAKLLPELPIQVAPQLMIRIPPVTRIALIFYLRSWQEKMGNARVWLSCRDEKTGHQYGEISKPLLLEGTWDIKYTLAAAAVLWPPAAAFQGTQGPDADQWKPPTPPCPFNTLHVQLLTPSFFLLIGHAET